MSIALVPIAVPREWGIEKLYGDVQKAVDAFFAPLCAAGFEPKDGVWVWVEHVRWCLQQQPITTLHKAGEVVKKRLIQPGRVLHQLSTLAREAVRWGVELFAGTDDEQTAMVPAFFHSQVAIARTLLLGGERDENGVWRPKPVPRAPAPAADGTRKGELLDPPGVRHTRDLMQIAVKLGVLKAFDRTSEEGHELNTEGRSKVHVFAWAQGAETFLRDLFARKRGGDAGRPPTPAPTRAPAAGSSPAASPAPMPFVPTRAPAAYRELVELYLAKHEAKYRAADEAKRQPYKPGNVRAKAERWSEIAAALDSFAESAWNAVTAKGHRLPKDKVRTLIIELILDDYLGKPSKERHPLSFLWSWSAKAQMHELFVLGPRAVDTLIEKLGEATPEPQRPPEPAPPAPEPEELDMDAPVVEIVDDGTTPETEADRERARAAAAALRARAGAPLEESAPPSAAPDSAPASEGDLVVRRRAPRGLTPEQVKKLAEIDAGRDVDKPPEQAPRSR